MSASPATAAPTAPKTGAGILNDVVTVQDTKTGAIQQALEFRAFYAAPVVPKKVYYTIMVVGDSRAGKTQLKRQAHRHFRAAVPVYTGRTIEITISEFSVFIGHVELVVRFVDTPGVQDTLHPDEAIREIGVWLENQAREHMQLAPHLRDTQSKLVNVVLVASGAHSENNALIALAEVTSKFAPTLACFMKVDAYTPQELADCKATFSRKIRHAGINLLTPDGIDVGFNLMGIARNNIAGQLIDPLDPNCDPLIQNRALWHYLNNHSGDLITESHRRSELALSRPVLRRLADGVKSMVFSHAGTSFLVALVAVLVIFIIGTILQGLPSQFFKIRGATAFTSS